MQISRIQSNYLYSLYNKQTQTPNHSVTSQPATRQSSVELPSFHTNAAVIHFGDFYDENRSVQDVTHESYIKMKDYTKLRYRTLYKNFHNTPFINREELYRPDQARLPLQDPETMDKFIEASSIYLQYKDQPIICLGRSPKWFLNTALWMKDGLKDYKFVAFSERWYRPDKIEGVRRMDSVAPTEKEIRAYKRYLKDIGADPKTIVKHMQETGKKTVITDYINSGKGVTSFLEVMANYADDEGILKEFSESIEIVGIGSMKYMGDLDPFSDTISQPSVILPEKLWPYYKNIKQTYHDIDYKVFEDMLLNENVNECRSTYYPHRFWPVYRPDRLKTGINIDQKTIRKKLKELNELEATYKSQRIGNKDKKTKKDDIEKPTIASFTPAMGDYRNLINFWILDNLDQRGLLKPKHHTKM